VISERIRFKFSRVKCSHNLKIKYKIKNEIGFGGKSVRRLRREIIG
jgi:hypothetical protein